MKVLVWQTAYLGDVVLATSLLQNAIDIFGEYNVGFVGRPFIKDVLYGYPIELHPYNRSLKDSFNILKAIKGYDAVLSLHVSFRSALMLYLSGIKKRIGFDRSEGKFLYTDLIPYKEKGIHEIERNIKLLELLTSKKLNPKSPKLYLEEEIKDVVKKKFRLPSSFIAISPISNFFLKTWKLEHFIALSKSLDKPVIILSDRRLEAFDNIKNVLNLSGLTSLKEFLAVVSLSSLVIANDSSAIHIANAFGVKAISIYCATSASYGFYPTDGFYLEPKLYCHPCSINPKSCKTNTYQCLDFVKPEDVLEKVKTIHDLFI
ncbi:MAG: glycosyltransferase family 9 protein [Hydrogenobaculum sp.]